MKKTLLISLFLGLLTMAVFAGGKTYSYTCQMQHGWNMIGIFLEPSAETQEQQEAYQFYEYSTQGNSGVFSRASEITAGKSYWLYWEDDAKELTIEGTLIDGLTMKSTPTDPEGAYDLTESVFAGNEIIHTAADVAGYKFTGWSATGVSLDDATAQTISFTMPANDVSLFPNYEKISYHWLTVDGNASWKKCGEALSVTATGKTGYSFVDWDVEGIDVPQKTAQTISFTMPDNDVTLTANYTANLYTLTVDGNSEQVAYNTTVTRTAPDRTGYTFTYWETDDLVDLNECTDKEVTFTMPAWNVTLIPHYTVTLYTLTVDGTTTYHQSGDDITVTAPEKDGFAFACWYEEGLLHSYDNYSTYHSSEIELDDCTSKTLNFSMPANDVVLKPVYLSDEKTALPAETLYLVVDLTTGKQRYSQNAPDLGDDTCRTTELWLRHIPAGTFVMGWDSRNKASSARSYGSRAPQHRVTLTEDFYIGVFEMTQKQYELIAGENPSELTGDCRPADSISYDTVGFHAIVSFLRGILRTASYNTVGFHAIVSFLRGIIRTASYITQQLTTTVGTKGKFLCSPYIHFLFFTNRRWTVNGN